MTTTAEETLAALGGDAAEVAQSLIDRGCRGMPRRGSQCPIAAVLGGQAAVCDDYAMVDAPDQTRRLVDLPEAVRDFIEAYDEGRLPRELQAALTVQP